MSQALIKVRVETAEAFLSAELHDHGSIDLAKLAELARSAIEKSNTSLAAAQAIAGGAFLARWLNSPAMQAHVIDSISHIRDISKVNLGLSAICNDLAAANLEHARRIDSNHRATNIGLDEIKALTAELLDHLRRPREPSVLDGLVTSLNTSIPTDQNAVREWLRELSNGIDQQYKTLHQNQNGLAKQLVSSDEAWVQIRTELARLGAAVQLRTAEANRQVALNSDRFSGISAQLDRRISDILVEVARQVTLIDDKVAESRRRLATDLKGLEQQLTKQGEQHAEAIAMERKSRDAMQKALGGILKKSESTLRDEISELKKRFNQRIVRIVGAILILQIAGFAYFSVKTGLWT